MIELKTKLRKWGNSFGVIVPQKTVERGELKEGAEITILIEQMRTTTVGDLMRLSKRHPLPKSKKSTAQIMREIDKELWEN